VIFTDKKDSRLYLEQLKKRYKLSRKLEKKIILDEFSKTTGHERKYAIKLLSGWYKHKAGKVHRPHRIYSLNDTLVLVRVCDLLDWINSKRIKPQIGLAIDSLVEAKELTVTREQKEKLVKISPATIDRLLTRYHKRPVVRGHSYTRAGTLLKTQIPVRTFADWSDVKVGFCEIDLVGHDGGLAKGNFSWTLNFVDVVSGWTEQIAVKSKAQNHVFVGIKTLRERLPFPLLGFDSDSGSEFLNEQLYHYSIEEKITFTRGRPGKKNDNAFVEEKNDSVIRKWVGYGRYDTEKQLEILNQLYFFLRFYTNFFLPVMKLTKKTRIGSRIKKIYDMPKTPYQRVLTAEDISKKVKNKLKEQYKILNLVRIKKQIDVILGNLKPTSIR